MIRKIKIAGIASYPDEGVTFEPKKVNYLFGTNGTGKTTISRVIGNPDGYDGCKINWENDHQLEVFVYNRDFIEKNFGSGMDGVFTLGEKQTSTAEKLQTKNAERSMIQDDLTGLNNTLLKKQEEWEKKFNQFKGVCWEQKVKFESDFRPALKGSMNSKASFCERVLKECEDNNSLLESFENLKEKAKAVFDKSVEKVDLIPVVDFSELKQILSNSIWQKVVVGSSDIEISSLIDQLQNSDWVSQGRTYLDHSDDSCPFCQQGLPHDFRDQLEQYFGDQFAEDSKLISSLIQNYENQCRQIMSPLEEISDGQKSFMDDNFGQIVGNLRQVFENNHRLIKQKEVGPSQKVETEEIQEICKKVVESISSANKKIGEHNGRISNASIEREKLIGEVWKYILKELNLDIENYRREDKNFKKKISSLEKEMEDNNKKIKELEVKLAGLQKKTVSIKPTVDAINKTLSDHGFTGFELAIDEAQKNKYRIIRDGKSDEDIHLTLSEGEKSFVTFLYFYHLIHGGLGSSNIMSERIVIFDDPVSSLDSDVLYIVSSLIKKIILGMKENGDPIKQVFVMTHNVFFHKEVSQKIGIEQNFWLLRKIDGQTSIHDYEKENPVKTTYQLLWDEIKQTPRSPTALPNAIRRILEFYFNVLGEQESIRSLPDKFENADEKMTVHSFVSWVHAGSHGPFDDEAYIPGDPEVELKIFKNIFEVSGHINHYNMMMNIE